MTQTTEYLVKTLRVMQENVAPNDKQTRYIIRAIELELFFRPVEERMRAGYRK
jgi:hypothetical protein